MCKLFKFIPHLLGQRILLVYDHLHTVEPIWTNLTYSERITFKNSIIFLIEKARGLKTHSDSHASRSSSCPDNCTIILYSTLFI